MKTIQIFSVDNSNNAASRVRCSHSVHGNRGWVVEPISRTHLCTAHCWSIKSLRSQAIRDVADALSQVFVVRVFCACNKKKIGPSSQSKHLIDSIAPRSRNGNISQAIVHIDELHTQCSIMVWRTWQIVRSTRKPRCASTRFSTIATLLDYSGPNAKLLIHCLITFINLIRCHSSGYGRAPPIRRSSVTWNSVAMASVRCANADSHGSCHALRGASNNNTHRIDSVAVPCEHNIWAIFRGQLAMAGRASGRQSTIRPNSATTFFCVEVLRWIINASFLKFVRAQQTMI